MCLILLSHGVHPEYPLVVAANRDEFLDRPAQPAAPWETNPAILAGRDLKEGGTWLGITAEKALCAITNFREPSNIMRDAPTRGVLVRDFLLSKTTALSWLEDLQSHDRQYNGFNLLTYRSRTFAYHSNRSGTAPRLVPPGFHGLSNHLLDTPWPKVEKGLDGFRILHENGTIQSGDLLDLLADSSRAPDELLPSTGVPREVERALSSMFIRMPGYGTRCSTAILFHANGDIEFRERTFDFNGSTVADRRYLIPEGMAIRDARPEE